MTKHKKQPRKQYVVNKNLQWRIAWQTIVTWIIGATVALLFPILALFVCGMGFAGMEFQDVVSDVSKAYTFPLMMATVFMPLAIWHSFQFSNRIAGPMYRFEKEIKKLNAGENVRPIKLREHDYWQSFASEFNTLVERLGRVEDSTETADTTETAETAEPEPEMAGA